MSRPLSKLISLSFAISLLIVQAFAQGGATGAITGTVQDPSGAVVASAEVRITNQDTNAVERMVKTDADGSFTAPLLPAGNYRVTVVSSSFAQSDFSDIVVRVTETTRLIAKLRPRTVQEKIEVQAEVQQVETTTPATGQAIEANTIRNLPLATQNFQQLLTLSSGAQSNLNSSSQLGRGDVRIEVNGQREDNNNYLIEGISATDYNVAELTTTPLPNPAVIQEFKVQTSLYDASQGRNGGGNINAILKTGTNSFHGEGYEFFRNTVLDANDYFLNQQGESRPVIQQNIFGGRPRRADWDRRKTWFLLRELFGHAAAQRRFSGHIYQHADSVCSGGRPSKYSCGAGGAGSGFRKHYGRSRSRIADCIPERPVRGSGERISFSFAERAGRNPRRDGGSVCGKQTGKLHRQSVHHELGPRVPQLE